MVQYFRITGAQLGTAAVKCERGMIVEVHPLLEKFHQQPIHRLAGHARVNGWELTEVGEEEWKRIMNS